MTVRMKALAALAATAMIAAPAAAAPAANPAAALSVAKSARVATPTTGKSRIAAGSTATFVSIGILAALVVIVLVATGGDDSDSN